MKKQNTFSPRCASAPYVCCKSIVVTNSIAAQEALGQSRGGFGSKIHALTDAPWNYRFVSF